MRVRRNDRTLKFTFDVAAVLLLTAILACTGEAGEVTRAKNDPDKPESVGERPYEMVWANRTEERVPLVDFEDLNGWTVESSRSKATLTRSREQQMWGSHVGKVVFAGIYTDSRFTLKPPAPVPIAGEFDSINMWVYGNNWEWEAVDPNNPRVELRIHFTDANGKDHDISLGNVRWKEWWLVHKKIEKETLDKLTCPCSFTGIEIRGAGNQKKSTIYLDSLSFYKETLKPLTFAPRAKRNIDAQPGQIPGVNTGEGTLPFPTRRETILPSNYEREYTSEVSGDKEKGFVFEYKGKDANVRYVYVPKKGSLGEISVFVNGKKVCRPLKDGGVKFKDDVAPQPLKLKSALITGVGVTAIFSSKRGDVKYNLWLWRKSLVIEAVCSSGEASELSLGYAGEFGGSTYELIKAPYLTMDYQLANNPRILMLKGQGGEPVFVSAWVDWYNSNASELFAESWTIGSGESVRVKFNGGARYIPKTDGARNPLFERVFLTASPIYEEVLPTIANPPASAGKNAGEYLWQESWGPENYDAEHKRSHELRSYGLEKIIQCNHEITWRDGGESFTFRTKAAPKRGGNAGLRRFVEKQKLLGWRSGLYTNYTDYSPVNEYWDEDMVSRRPDGEWGSAWARCYAPKPSRAVEFDAKLAPTIEEKYRSNAAYTDVHTAVAPWHRTDYDARVPGAGTFAATFYAFGELLRNDQDIYGPTFSEGIYHWMYAGLPTGNYAQDPTYDFYAGPLNVAFDLLKIHPLETDIGMAWTQRAFDKRADARYPEEDVDRFIAATVAYGHIGWLVEERYGMRQVARSYYMVQQAAKRYSMENVNSIEYADKDNKWLTTSQAMANGAFRDSRLHVEYENGLNVFVNWSRDENWELPAESTEITGRKVVLPPGGMCVFDGDGFFEAMSLVDGRRVDEVVSDEYLYIDGHDKWTDNGSIAAEGAAAVRFDPYGKVDIADIGGNDQIAFKSKYNKLKCEAMDASVDSLGNVGIKILDGYAYLTCVPGARSYTCWKQY